MILSNLSTMKAFYLALFTLFSVGRTLAQDDFFSQVNAFFGEHVTDGRLDYGTIRNDEAFPGLVQQVAAQDLAALADDARKAFLINAYNILVIKGVIDHYPISSVQDVAGFFDRKRYVVAGQSLTLNELEKSFLLEPYQDARLHFVLVCGAVGCPPIINGAYRPETVEQQLEQQTRQALSDPSFIRIDTAETSVELSQIFRWYAADFGGSQQNIVAFINRFREKPLPDAYRIGFYNYDWSLNGRMTGLGEGVRATNAARYIVSSTIPRGTTETKIFNNLYSERTRDATGEFTQRATFFTNINSFLYGVSHRLNVGFDLRYRMARYGAADDTPLDVFTGATRQGVTTIGPKVRFAPVPQWTNFSVQSAFWFPVGDDLAGRSGEQRFIDWDGATWWTQIFNDFPIGTRFSLFTELDILWEDIGGPNQNRANRWSTPAILILSYFPTPQATVYAIGTYSPFWQQNFAYFVQAGLGTKYQFTPNFELELSYTWFSNDFLAGNMGRAATYNVGVRFNL